ncbi:hypothetical protein G7054_g6804 [Neopestalotiopsis clavispora]|nr:hypothetical protein G7054_g6804 [Neopestalotiopsis clavispora]
MENSSNAGEKRQRETDEDKDTSNPKRAMIESDSNRETDEDKDTSNPKRARIESDSNRDVRQPSPAAVDDICFILRDGNVTIAKRNLFCFRLDQVFCPTTLPVAILEWARKELPFRFWFSTAEKCDCIEDETQLRTWLAKISTNAGYYEPNVENDLYNIYIDVNDPLDSIESLPP